MNPFDRLLLKLLRLIVPTTGMEVIFYLGVAASAAGQVVAAENTRKNEQRRQIQLKLEMKNAELAALDEENERLRMLDLANSEAIANAGNLDPFASPSLMALRRFNFEIANQDIANIRTNLATSRAGFSMQLAISRSNERTARTTGILGALGTIGQGAATGIKTFGRPGEAFNPVASNQLGALDTVTSKALNTPGVMLA